MLKKIILVSALSLTSTQMQAFDLGKVIKNSGGDLVKAATLSESDVFSHSRLAVQHMDANSNISSQSAQSSQRLDRLVRRIKLPKLDGVKFNFKVYKTESGNLNAFATPDGSIRFHSALMDAMNDEQVLAVLGHEIGHVVEKHAYKEMKKALLTSAGIRAAAGTSSTATSAYNAGAGKLANKFLKATFSKKDEISADKYALKVLKGAGAPAESMLEAIKILKAAYGNGGGMMSSHPSNSKRIKKLEKTISSGS